MLEKPEDKICFINALMFLQFRLLIEEQVTSVVVVVLQVCLCHFVVTEGTFPWHRVHAVSPEGPVGRNGIIQPGDHLIEVRIVHY